MDSSRSSMQKNTCAGGLPSIGAIGQACGSADGSPVLAESRVRASAHRPGGGCGGAPIRCMPSLRSRMTPIRNRRACHFVSGKPDHARCIIDAGGAAQAASLLGLERAFLGRRLRAPARGHPGHGQTHRQEVHQRTRHRVDAEPGRDLLPACASGPPSRASASNSA
jgi:hypothetical protein